MSPQIGFHLGFGRKACNEKVGLQNYSENLDRSTHLDLHTIGAKTEILQNYTENIDQSPNLDLRTIGANKSGNPPKIIQKIWTRICTKIGAKLEQVGLRAEQTTADRESVLT